MGLHELPVAKTKYYKLSDLNNRSLCTLASGGHEPESQVL